MGRAPRRVELDPKQLSLEFARSVTEKSIDSADWVARNGEYSLYRTLTTMYPKVSHRRDPEEE